MTRVVILMVVVLLAGCAPSPGGTSVPIQHQAATATPIPVAHVQPPAAIPIPTQPITHHDPTPIPVPDIQPTTEVASVVAYAETWLGVRYAWGGCSRSPGIDCSCFVRTVLATLGINAPRVTTQQIQWVTLIPASAAQALDLVFFDNTCTDCGANPTHVGLYLGGGMMIDAGDPVRIEPVYGGHNARYGRPPGLWKGLLTP